MITAPPLDGHCGKIVGNRKDAYSHLLHILAEAKTEIRAFMGSHTLCLTADDKQISAQRVAAKDRGVKLRYITEITKDNLQYCKRVNDMVTELRHLDNIAGNFIISDSEIGATPEVSAEKPISFGFYSNLPGVLTLYRGIFETFWNCAIPFDVKIKQLEAGDESRPRPPPTIVVNNKFKIVIDRFYVCKQCAWTSAFLDDAEAHEESTGHKQINEFPIFD